MLTLIDALPIYAEIEIPHRDQDARDPVGAAELQREGAGEEFLGVGQLRLGDALVAHPRPFPPNDLQRFADPLALRRDLADEQDRKSTRLNSSHLCASRMPPSA